MSMYSYNIIYARIFVCECAYERECVLLHMYLYILIYYTYACVCMYVYACVHISAFLDGREFKRAVTFLIRMRFNIFNSISQSVVI